MESCRDSMCLNCWGWSNPLEQSHLHGKTWDCIIHAQKSSSKPLPGWPHTSDVLMSHHCSREVFFVAAQKARRFTLIPLITHVENCSIGLRDQISTAAIRMVLKDDLGCLHNPPAWYTPSACSSSSQIPGTKLLPHLYVPRGLVTARTPQSMTTNDFSCSKHQLCSLYCTPSVQRNSSETPMKRQLRIASGWLWWCAAAVWQKGDGLL